MDSAPLLVPEAAPSPPVARSGAVPWFAVARAVWPVVSALGVTFTVLAVTMFFRVRDPHVVAALPAWRLTPTGFAVAFSAVTVIPMLVYLVVAIVVYLRAPTDRMALTCSYVLVAFGCGVVGPLPYIALSGFITLPGGRAVTELGGLLTPLGLFAIDVFFFVFPSGRFAPRWLRWLTVAAVAVLLASSVLLFTGETALAGAIFQAVGACLLVVGVAAQAYRYLRVSTPAQRRQTKWVLLGLAGCVAVFVLSRAVGLAMPSSLAHSPVADMLVGAGSVEVALAILPIGIGIAILRARLWDIDVIVNRTLLYGGLTVSVALIYVLVVGYLGHLLRSDTSTWMSLVATGVVAVVVQPLRSQLQRSVNRLTYGQRDEPYAVVAELGRRLETSGRTESVLPDAVETLAIALKLPYAAVVLHAADGSTVTAAAYGEPTDELLTVPLTYHSEPVGALRLGPRRRGEPFTPSDLRLLRDLARQLSAAAHAVALTDDLRRSRQQLVTAREEERRRLRRDLHDGLGPTLAGLALKANTVARLIDAEPARATGLADELYHQIRGTIAEIRRLVYELRPPSLDELGLEAAIREAAEQAPRPVTVTVDGEVSELPAAVEVAVYRIACEALTNVARHARATSCALRLRRGDSLELEIVDDGVGFGPGQRSGVGLIAMRERAGELGGTCTINSVTGTGTQVLVRLPLPSQEGVDAAAARTDR
jgi:signal transduction histidine kinase